jgi:hypothetical protein
VKKISGGFMDPELKNLIEWAQSLPDDPEIRENPAQSLRWVGRNVGPDNSFWEDQARKIESMQRREPQASAEEGEESDEGEGGRDGEEDRPKWGCWIWIIVAVIVAIVLIALLQWGGGGGGSGSMSTPSIASVVVTKVHATTPTPTRTPTPRPTLTPTPTPTAAGNDYGGVVVLLFVAVGALVFALAARVIRKDD